MIIRAFSWISKPEIKLCILDYFGCRVHFLICPSWDDPIQWNWLILVLSCCVSQCLTLDCGQHPGNVITTRWLVLATTITPQRTQNPLTPAVVPVLQFSQRTIKTPRLGNCSSVIVGRSRPTSLESHVHSQKGAKIDIQNAVGILSFTKEVLNAVEHCFWDVFSFVCMRTLKRIHLHVHLVPIFRFSFTVLHLSPFTHHHYHDRNHI